MTLLPTPIPLTRRIPSAKPLLLALAVLFSTVFGTSPAAAQQPLNGPRPTASKRPPLPPQARGVVGFAPINFKEAAVKEKKNPPKHKGEIEGIEAPQPPPPGRKGVPVGPGGSSVTGKVTVDSTPSFGTGVSPGPAKSFKAEFLNSTSIPPDTMGAVGTTHIVSVTNDRMRIQTREGVELARLTLTSFWAGVTIKGAAIAAFDPKVMFDRFNNRFILISSGNSQNVNSGAMFAVSATADPTGAWYRWAVASDATSTAAGGHWIDYPSMGFNKNWIVVNENVFNYGTAGAGFWGTQIYVLDKQAAYSNTLSTINLFEAAFTPTCSGSATPELELACGFTMAPAITEDNTTDTMYLVEDWDSTAGQLRLSKITGTPSAPIITVGTQFPQSSESWRFDAARISNKTTATLTGATVTSSGGYVPQRQQSANLPSGTRVMANDSRVQNAVYRDGTLWCAHTVMLAATSQAAGQEIGRLAANPPDIRSGIQWWAIDPTTENSASTPPLQRGRIFDPTADNCHNGLGGQNIIAGRCTSTATQTGEFFAFPNISVNQNNDVFIGFTRFSPLTYPNSAYVIRRSGDPINTTRDVVVFRPGQANYNLGSGSSTASHPTNPTRQNRWGDYSAAQTDPLNDTDFWTVQEYSGTVRDFGIGLAGNWETWWSMVKPGATQPSTSGSPIISEFRLRGPQGVRDEFVEIYNPSASPIVVNTTDGSEGWALAYSTTGAAINAVIAVIPNGTVIPARGHFLIVDNPDASAGPTLTYSLNTAASTEARGAESDTGWSLDLPDNGGLALFSTATQANMTAGTRLDSVGFSTTAAGLFKEGNGIPAITSTTPTGQMTFYRNLSSGTPADTGANETDFVFANTVTAETLGSTPKLGAAGPENLSSPINLSGASTLPAALLDGGVGLATAPNRVRDNTVVANGAFGTLTFRRTFTNNTGAPLSRLRFRVVDMTTSPAAGSNADLRVLSASSSVVSVSGGGTVNVSATTLEVPPAQAAGGGLNGTLTVPSVTFNTPLAGGATVNLQFTLGVQVAGLFNFCIVPEGDGAIASAPICFAGNSENAAPIITPAGPIAINAGSSVVGTTIATVSDAQDAAGTLVVTAISAPVGISVTGITNTAGTITATVAATCSAPAGDNNVTLQVIDSEGATATATLVVSVTATPPPSVPSIGGLTSTCAGTPVTLTATATGAVSYQWYLDGNALGGETASTLSASTSGSYTVEATNTCGTSPQSAAHVLTVNPIPATPTISGTLTFCTGSSTTLTSSSASGNQWYLDGSPIGGATGQQHVASTAGDYTVIVTLLGCPSTSSAASTVTETPIPNAPVITPGGPTTFCTGGSVLLSASASSNYQWYRDGNPLGGATSQTYNATIAGTYTVTVSPAGCESAPSSGVAVTINPIPATPTITPGGPTTFCTGGSVTLTSSSASGNQWYLDGNPIGGATGQQYVANASGSYTVDVTATGCTSPASSATTVTVNPIPSTPTIGAGGPTTFCAGGSVTLTSSSASGNQWYLDGNPIGGATAQQYAATGTGSYTVVVTASGCSSAASAPTAVTVNPVPATPTITPGGPTTFCTGGSVTLTSSSASGNQWYLDGNPIGGATAQQYVANASGNYTVTVTATGCTSAPSAATTVTVNPIPSTPTIGAGGPTTFCAGGSVTLTSSSASGNQWYLDGNPIGGATAQQYVATGTGSYTVIVTTSGCSSPASAPTSVTVNPVPSTPTIGAGGPTTFCTGGSVTLTSSSASGNQWLLNGNPIGGATAQQYVATASGNYTVTVTATGCTSAPSAATTVTVNPIPSTPTIGAGGPTTFCAGGSVTLTSSSASGNQWYLDGSPIGGATAQQYVATGTGSYTVIVTTSGCSSAASAPTSVTVNPVPSTPTITPGGPTTFCAGGSVTLTSSSASGNQWLLNGNPIGGATAQQYVATANGNYTVTVTGSGCTSAASAATTVTVNPVPSTPTIGAGGPTTFCAGGSVTLTSSSASGNQWFLNGSPIGGATAQQYVATATGSYTVTVTTGGCSSAASAATAVTANPVPATPTITPGGPTAFCAGGNVTLTSSSASGNQWFLNGSPIGGATAQQYVATGAGDYTVTVTATGCSSASSAATTVTVNPNPVATITVPGNVQAGSTGNVASVPNAGAGATYNWTIGNGTITAGTGTNSITFTAGAAGTLTLNVTVTSGAGCATPGNTSVTVTAVLPSVTVTSITPSNGPVFGNTPITIHGTGFLAGATVTLGGTAATNVVVVNSTTITAKTAPHAGGPVNVVVTNTNTASGTLTNGFTYRPQQFDPNNDQVTDPADIFYLVNFLFTGGPAPAGVAGMLSGDANGDGAVDPSDIFYVVHYLFTSGPAPSALPVRTASASVSTLRGAVTLGQAQRRDGRWIVPVVVTMEPGSAMPDSLSLRVRFSGQAADATVRRVVPEQPVFEISRLAADALSYLVSFDARTPLMRADGRPVVVAELSLPAGAGRLDVDPSLTMLAAGGTQKATVAGGTLRVTGTTIVNGDDAPRPRVPNSNAN